MISQQEIIDIICTEAIEHGGLQEVPRHKNGATQSYHSRKRDARGQNNQHEPKGEESELEPLSYDLRLISEDDGSFKWKD